MRGLHAGDDGLDESEEVMICLVKTNEAAARQSDAERPLPAGVVRIGEVLPEVLAKHGLTSPDKRQSPVTPPYGRKYPQIAPIYADFFNHG